VDSEVSTGEAISAVIFTKNEENNIAACIESMAGVDEVLVADDSSTDRTVEIAESLGARVITRHDEYDTPTKEDIAAFTERFGWAPAFTTEDTFIPAASPVNVERVMEHVNTDWVVGPDADERVTWDLPRIREEIMPTADQIDCEFVHSHDEQGNPHKIAHICKMYKRSQTGFYGRTHSCIVPRGRMVEIPFMRIDHWQTPRENRHWYVRPILEYAVLKEDGQRDRFYLGREYYYYKMYDEALTLLNLYLENATWQPEIAQARLYAARCYWESGRGDEARKSCLEAVILNPMHKEALYLMAEMYYPPWGPKWAKLAEAADDSDILF
jgi:glycosyltransferase involved in cell wall biosynthesis